MEPPRISRQGTPPSAAGAVAAAPTVSSVLGVPASGAAAAAAAGGEGAAKDERWVLAPRNPKAHIGGLAVSLQFLMDFAEQKASRQPPHYRQLRARMMAAAHVCKTVQVAWVC